MKIFKRHEAPTPGKKQSGNADTARTRGDTGKTADAEEAVFNRPARSDEKGGPTGPEPTRFGDWERKGRCVDF